MNVILVTEYGYCKDLVERFDPDRYLCSLFAPAAVRPGLMALYAFNVEVAGIRESVTEPLIGQMRLQWWIDIMDSIFRLKQYMMYHIRYIRI